MVRDGSYSDAIMTAYYNFGNTHGDVAVVLDQRYAEPSAIIEAMMSRDSSTDIYMMSVASEAYDALYNRGFLVELQNEELVSAGEGMYPAIREALMRDGDVVAIPVSVYGWTLGLDYEGFEKIGIAREDVPDNWSELIDLLPELPDMLPEDGSVRIFEEYMDQDSAKSQLLRVIMDSWHTQQTAAGIAPSYDSPELVELFDKVLSMDYEALGLPEADENGGYMEYMYSYDGERTYILLETGVGCTIGNFYSNRDPVLLSLVPGEAGCLPLQMSVAFINPFSENVELAEEFLAELMRNTDMRTAYNLSDALNEPVRSRYAEESIAESEKMLAELQAQLDTADPVDKLSIEDSIADFEQQIEDMERYGWDISAKEIEWYRAHEDAITVERFNFLYASDDDELSDLAQQFMAGKIGSADFLKEVDRKVRMRAQEGN